MSWQEFIRTVVPAEKGADFALRPAGPPASPPILDELETTLGVVLPPELRGLLGEMNGVRDKYGPLIMSAEEMLKTNRSFRENEDFGELYMPFDCLLFFAEAGNGDLFAYPVVAGTARPHDIFAWDHENDSRIWVAPALRTCIEWWVTGKISL